MESLDKGISAELAEDATPQEEAPECLALPRRTARISVRSFVTLNADWGCVQVKACDVSTEGIKIEVDMPLAPGPVTVKLPGFPIFTGEVRWRDAHHAGLRFLRPIPNEFLATWVRVHGLHDEG
jgi:hypothetical protein